MREAEIVDLLSNLEYCNDNVILPPSIYAFVPLVVTDPLTITVTVSSKSSAAAVYHAYASHCYIFVIYLHMINESLLIKLMSPACVTLSRYALCFLLMGKHTQILGSVEWEVGIA